MKFSKDKFLKIVYPALYIALIVACVITGCITFSRLYYQPIYVSGPSMQPTLIGGVNLNNDGVAKYHYGQADISQGAINNVQRFDVVITSYPQEWGFDEETYIIKRVWGLPGEHIELVRNASDYTFTVYEGSAVKEKYVAPIINEEIYSVNKTATFTTNLKSFKVNADGNRIFDRILAKDEIFLMGDNWNQSTDCYREIYVDHRSDYLTISHLKGKVISIDGYAELKNNTLVNKVAIKRMINF